VNGYEGRPSRTQLDQVDLLSERLAAAEARLESIGKGGLAEVNKALTARKLEPVNLLSREEWEKKGQ
jgi:hypothetical protein